MRATRMNGRPAIVTGDAEHMLSEEEADDLLKQLSEVVKTGPYGCKCQNLHHHISGDGCDICNPELARELSE